MSLRTSLLATLAAGALLAGAGPASAATQAQIDASVTSGANWLDTQQAGDGTFDPGFSSFDPTPPAFAAAGRHPADVSNGGASLQQAIFTALADPSNSAHPTETGGFQNGILSAFASGIDPARLAPTENLAADLGSTYIDGYFGDATLFNSVAYGTLALSRVRAPRFLVDRSVSVVRANHRNDGGWGFTRSTDSVSKAEASDVDVTGAAMGALCESGVPSSDAAIQDAVAFLQSQFVPSTGGFLSFGTSNSNTNAAAISGLNACDIDPQGPGFNADETPVDYLLARQGPSNGANNGSFEYADPPNPFVTDGPNLPASRDAVRALAGAAFSADPPARSNPSDPRTRALPLVAEGTTVSVALAVDDGAGSVTLCRVNVPSGASLATLLAAADGSATPSGCATGGEFTGGRLSKLNGQAGRWVFSVDGSGEQVAAAQTVRFGDFVALRRIPSTTPAVPGTSGDAPAGLGGDTTPPAPVPAAQQAKTTPTGVSSKALKVSARNRVVSLSLSCATDNRLCQGVAYVVYGKRTLGRRPFLIGGGKTTKVNVKLYKSAIKRLGKRKRKVKVNVFSRDGAGIASTSSRTLTLTPTK